MKKLLDRQIEVLEDSANGQIEFTMDDGRNCIIEAFYQEKNGKKQGELAAYLDYELVADLPGIKGWSVKNGRIEGLANSFPEIQFPDHETAEEYAGWLLELMEKGTVKA